MTATNPPTWAVELFQRHCYKINQFAEKHDLPFPVTKEGLIPTCDLGKEYGSGFYGIVWPTEKPGTVFKITTDQTEAHAIKITLDFESRSTQFDGIVRYYGIAAIPEKHLRRNLFLVWREEVASVGKYPKSPEASRFRDDLWSWKNYGDGARRNALRKSAPSGDAYWKWLDRQLDGDNELVNCIDKLRAIALRMANSSLLSTLVGTTLGAYLKRGLIISDVHENNVGRVEGRGYVITDPGHLVVLDRKYSEPAIVVI